MKCSKCGAEWKTANDAKIIKCPFCGEDLAQKEDTEDNEAVRTIKDIIKKYGKNIFMQKERFIGLFGDLAPKLSYEKKALSYAMNERIITYFNCDEADREKNFSSARTVLEDILSEKAVRVVMEIFVKVFGWDIKLLDKLNDNNNTVSVSSERTEKNSSADDGDDYSGEKNAQGQPHGKGIMHYKNGDIYNGEWQNGKRHGIGTMTSGSRTYNGQWKNDQFVKASDTGIDKKHYPDGSDYTGDLVNGKRHGRGTMKFFNGNIYSGEWENDIISGKGTFTYKNGDKYVGEYKYGKRSGKGTFTFVNGSSYTGEWANDHYSGHGRFVFKNGNIYDGEWQGGKRNGIGTFTNGSSVTYGEWMNDILIKKLDINAKAPEQG